MKKRRHSLERAARWGCTALAALSLIAWAFTWWRDLSVVSPATSDHRYAVVLLSRGNATLSIRIRTFEAGTVPPGPHFKVLSRGKLLQAPNWLPQFRFSGGWLGVAVPLPILLPLLAGSSVWLWVRFLRRRTQVRIGLVCPECLYSRLGLAPGAPCPECGTVPKPEASG